MGGLGLRQESCQKCGVEAMDGFLIHHPKGPGKKLWQTSLQCLVGVEYGEWPAVAALVGGFKHF